MNFTKVINQSLNPVSVPSKPGLKQKTTWLGVALLGWGVYNLIFGDQAEAVVSIGAGLSSIFSADSK
jgi:hypothetical protein